jgi:hypothetical protein
VFCLIDVHEVGCDRFGRDFFRIRALRLAFLIVMSAALRLAAREEVVGNGRARSGDHAVANGVGAVHNRVEARQLGGHRPPSGRKADGKSRSRGHEFEHRRGRLRLSRRARERQRRDQPGDANAHSLELSLLQPS